MPGTSRLICVASKAFPRYSEADVIPLSDGRLMLAVARKNGASDFAKGEIISLISSDAGLTWSDTPTLVQSAFEDVGDLMSISFARTDRGLHLFFLGRGPKAAEDTRVYQLLSKDEGKTWSKPRRVSERNGYHILNNARVVKTRSGRLIAPCAYVPGDIHKQFNEQRVHCLLSDDAGVTWHQSNELSLEKAALMEPGVVECEDGSFYMTIRTALGVLYEARSNDNGSTWIELRATTLASPAAPSTAVRLPERKDLWLFWCDRPKAGWKGRSRLVFASSHDHGATWSEPQVIEDDAKHSYAYTSFTRVRNHALLTYYDWEDKGQPDFQQTNLRQRLIPLAWFDGGATPPAFRKHPKPVLEKTEMWEGNAVSMNSGLLVGRESSELWRAYYTAIGPKGSELWVCRAASADQGLTWAKSEFRLPENGVQESVYHPSVHWDGERVIMYAWRTSKDRNGLYRYVSNDGQTFALELETPLLVSPFATAAEKERASTLR